MLLARLKLKISERLARLLTASLPLALGSATLRIATLLGMVFIARCIGQTDFGKLGAIQSTIGMAGVFAGAGLGAAATRFVSSVSAQNPQQLAEIVSRLRLLSWVAVTATALLLLAVAGLLAENVFDSPTLRDELALGAAMLAGQALRGLENGILNGLERFWLAAKLNIVESLLTLVAVAFAWLGGLRGALIGLAVASIVTWVIGRLILRKILPRTDWRGIVGSSGRTQEILRFSLPVMAASLISAPVLWFCVTLLARSNNGFEELARYNAAYQWHGPLIFLPMIFVAGSVPALVRHWETSAIAEFRASARMLMTATLVIAGVPASVLAALSPLLLRMYGAGFEDGWHVMVVLMLSAPIHAMSNVCAAALSGMNRPMSILLGNSVWAVAMLTFGTLLVPSQGALGLSLAFALSYLFQTVILMTLTFRVFVMPEHEKGGCR